MIALAKPSTCAVHPPPSLRLRLPPPEKRERGVFTRVSGPCWPCLRVSFISKVTRKKSQQLSALFSHLRREEREGRTPRKWAVLALLACCVHRELNAQEEPAHQLNSCSMDPLTPCNRLSPEERERGACTRVSGTCWPCLRVSFISKVTRKKSQHSTLD